MTKKQLMALMQIIKGVNTLRSDFTDRRYTQSDIRKDSDLFNRLVIEAPFKESAWALSLFIENNSTMSIEINDKTITFS